MLKGIIGVILEGFMGLTGRIFKIQRHSLHDGPGIRTTVFLKGCPLRCAWCFNPESQASESEIIHYEEKCIGCNACMNVCPSDAIIGEAIGKHIDRTRCTHCLACADACLASAMKAYGKDMATEDVLEEVLKDKVFYKSDGGVTLSGGDALMQPDFSAELLSRCKESGLNTAIETCGYGDADKLRKILRYTDHTMFDIKVMDEEKHIAFTGVSNKIILENAKIAARESREMKVCVPVIPGCNDDDKGLEQIARFVSRELGSVSGVLLHPYNLAGVSKYQRLSRNYQLQNTVAPTDEEMKGHARVFEKYGIPVSIGG